MRRRAFMSLIAGAVLLAPNPALPQEDGRSYRLGMISANPRAAPQLAAFFDELRQLGFAEGRNLTLDFRGPIGPEQLATAAAALAALPVDVIVCNGPGAIRAAQTATRMIPILGLSDDMVAAGLVSSLARPGGNTTGISILAPELDGKRQDILIEMAPGARRLAALADTGVTTPHQLQMLRDAARARGIELSLHAVSTVHEIVPAIDAAHAGGAAALNVLATPLFSTNRRRIIEHMAALRLPAIYQWPEMAEQGGLAAYGPRLHQLYRQLARQVAKALRGVKPAEIPVEQPARFELVFNLKTAKAIGVELPTPILLRADEIIE